MALAFAWFGYAISGLVCLEPRYQGLPAPPCHDNLQESSKSETRCATYLLSDMDAEVMAGMDTRQRYAPGSAGDRSQILAHTNRGILLASSNSSAGHRTGDQGDVEPANHLVLQGQSPKLVDKINLTSIKRPSSEASVRCLMTSLVASPIRGTACAVSIIVKPSRPRALP